MNDLLRIVMVGAFFLIFMAIPGNAYAFDRVALSVVGMALVFTLGATDDAEPETPAEPAAPMVNNPVPVAFGPSADGFALAQAAH